MNDDQHFSTCAVEYEEAGPRYSDSYLARIGHLQQLSSNRNSANSVSRSGELIDENFDDDRSVTVAPIRDFVEEDDKEAENISIPDRLCQPESPTVVCIMGNAELGEADHTIVESSPVVEEYSRYVPIIPQSIKLQRQTSEEKKRTFGSLGPMNKMSLDIKESSSLHNRPRSQVSGWAKLFASTLQRSKSTVSQDICASSQKNVKMRPGRKSEQPIISTNSSISAISLDPEGIDTLSLKADMRKKKRSIGVDMREKLGFFRKQFGDTGTITNTNISPCIKTGNITNFMSQLDHVWQSTGGPPSKEQISSWRNSFEDLLYDKHGISLFLEFLRSEFSDENLEFWSECQIYRSIDCPRKLQEKAIQIYEDYVAEQSPREINIDSVTRIQTSLDITNATVNTFDQSQKKIQALMEKDSYQRFLRSDIYHNLASQFSSHSLILGKLSHANSIPGEPDLARISYIPGLLPKVTSCTKGYQIRTNTNPSLLSISECEPNNVDITTEQGHHRSAPSSPKNITASTIS